MPFRLAALQAEDPLGVICLQVDETAHEDLYSCHDLMIRRDIA